MQIKVNGQAIEIFSGACVKDVLRKYSRGEWKLVQKNKKKVCDGHGHEVGLDGELTRRRGIGHKRMRAGDPAMKRVIFSTPRIRLFLLAALVAAAFPSCASVPACAGRDAHRHLPLQRHPRQDRQLRQGGRHHRGGEEKRAQTSIISAPATTSPATRSSTSTTRPASPCSSCSTAWAWTCCAPATTSSIPAWRT